jgi:hypothetical protein
VARAKRSLAGWVAWVVLVGGGLYAVWFVLTYTSGRSLGLRLAVATLLGTTIFLTGRRVLAGFSVLAPEARLEEPEEVEELEVYFVCGECGTEYKVTRLGELSVPRHCGEPMQVVRRPVQDPTLN